MAKLSRKQQADLNVHDDPSTTQHQQESKRPVSRTVSPISSLPSSTCKRSKASHVVPSRPLQHFNLVFYLTIAYTVAAVFAWVVTCVLVYCPIATRSYGLRLDDGDAKGLRYPSSERYIQNERWYQAARVIQAVVAVITIPLTSAVCSGAAVVFVQQCCKTEGLSLRQTVVLADKGWNDFEVYEQLLKGRWKQYASRLLYVAIGLNLLGAIVSPLQSIVLTTTTKQVPAHMTQVGNLSDLLSPSQQVLSDDLAVVNLRAKLVTTKNNDPQSRLWSAQGAMNCTADGDGSTYAPCAFAQLSLSNLSAIDDPFLAQLPAGYSTGLVRQFLPRVNSSTSRTRITEMDWPAGCERTPTFFASHVQPNTPSGVPWHVMACMLESQARPNHTLNRKRLDISETLYLNLSSGGLSSASYLFKITINTTSGFFELPNYMNDQRPGQLLKGDPSSQCGRDCIAQGLINGITIYDHENDDPTVVDPRIPFVGSRDTQATYAHLTTPNATYGTYLLPQKGPLLTIALALFGPGSYIADRAYENVTIDQCVDRPPLRELLSDLAGEHEITDRFKACINDPQQAREKIHLDAMRYIKMFYRQSVMLTTLDVTYDQVVENAFAAAAFLANEQWLTSGLQHNLIVSQDAGISIRVPYISAAGIAVVTLLLGIYLIALMAVAIYSKVNSRWTERLDALTMMQFGAAIAKDLPFAIIGNDRHVEVLDTTPGWVGDEKRGLDDIGQMSLGNGTPLQATKRYLSFEYRSGGHHVNSA